MGIRQDPMANSKILLDNCAHVWNTIQYCWTIHNQPENWCSSSSIYEVILTCKQMPYMVHTILCTLRTTIGKVTQYYYITLKMLILF